MDVTNPALFEVLFAVNGSLLESVWAVADAEVRRGQFPITYRSGSRLATHSGALNLTPTRAMPADPMPDQIVVVAGQSNQEFLQRYAQAGRIGLCSGVTLIDKAICRAQRHLNRDKAWGFWSYVFLFQGQRVDGHHWVVESDLQVHRKHIQLGVQENRVSKYFDEHLYTTLAVLDFHLSDDQVSQLLREALELAANRARYSLRELAGTLLALRHPKLRNRRNLLARESSMYCSAFVQCIFRKTGLDLAPGVNFKNTTPEHIAQTSLPHVTYWLQRKIPSRRIHFPKLKVRHKSTS
jgi:hypothetical protein